MNFEPGEKAVPIRQPATANLQVDSSDRDENKYPSPFSFYITQPQSILNGFFTRIGMTETQLQWDIPNISRKGFGNNTLSIDLALLSSGVSTLNSTVTLNYQNGWVQSSSNFFSTTVGRLNPIVSSMSTVFSLDLSGFQWNLKSSNTDGGNMRSVYKLNDTRLGWQTNIYDDSTYANTLRDAREVVNPDFRPYKYIDFVSPNLTYNQDLKDSSTNPYKVDVLQRWFFSYDQENTYDGNNWPIYMGYKPFSMRRAYPMPKQIKWSPNMPIGQIEFQVYGQPTPQVRGVNKANYGAIPDSLTPYETNFQFTLQVSEN